MPLIYRYKLIWQLPTGGPGVTTLFAFPDTTEQVFADQARLFVSDALNVATAHDSLPSGCTIQGDSIVDNLEVTDGLLASAVPVTAPAVITGSLIEHLVLALADSGRRARAGCVDLRPQRARVERQLVDVHRCLLGQNSPA